MPMSWQACGMDPEITDMGSQQAVKDICHGSSAHENAAAQFSFGHCALHQHESASPIDSSLQDNLSLPDTSSADAAAIAKLPPRDQSLQQQDRISLTAMLGQVCVQWSGASSFEAGPSTEAGKELSQQCQQRLQAEQEQLLAKGLRGLVEAVLKGRQQQHDAAVFCTRQIFLRLAGSLQVRQHTLASPMRGLQQDRGRGPHLERGRWVGRRGD